MWGIFYGGAMKDKKFLLWVHNRLINIYHEDPDADFVQKLKAIAEAQPEGNATERPHKPKKWTKETITL
jgi:hypothetical protein